MTYPYGETVQVLDGSVTGRDSYGDDQRTYPVKATYDNVAVWPADGNGTGGNEFQDGRDTVTIGLVVSLPDGADIQPTDRVIARGQTWEVQGQPGEYASPLTGWRPGLPVALRRITG